MSFDQLASLEQTTAFVEGALGRPLAGTEHPLIDAIKQYHAGSVPEALAVFGALAQNEANGATALARALLGTEFLRRGMIAQARECVMDALRLDPDNESLWELMNQGVLPATKLEVFVEMTKKCNFQCIFCGHPHLPGAVKKILSLDFLKKFESILKSASNVDITGYGEITIHPEFDGIVQYLTSLGAPLSFVSNGSQLTDERVDRLIYSTMSRLTVSVNSLDQSIHTKLSYGFIEGHPGSDLDSILTAVRKLARHPDRKFTLNLAFVIIVAMPARVSETKLCVLENRRHWSGERELTVDEAAILVLLTPCARIIEGLGLSCISLDTQAAEGLSARQGKIPEGVETRAWALESVFIQ